MPPSEHLLFVWTYRLGSREFIIETFLNGESILFDETVRFHLCHAGKNGRMILLDEIAADEPSPEKARKAEFGIEFSLPPELLDLIQKARTEFDQRDDISSELEANIRSQFAPIFTRKIEPYLTVPISG